MCVCDNFCSARGSLSVYYHEQVLNELPPDLVLWLPAQRRLLVPSAFAQCIMLSRRKFCTGMEPLFALLHKRDETGPSGSTSSYAPCHSPVAQEVAAAKAIMHSVLKYNSRLVECASTQSDSEQVTLSVDSSDE